MSSGVASGPPVLLRVVVSDSGMSINDSLTALLSEFEGLSVLGCAQEPAKVLTLVRTAKPTAVILDLQTETSAWLKMLKQIKHLAHAPVAIVLSPYDLPPLRAAAIAAGADHFLVKATECGLLQEVLQTVRRRRGAQPNRATGPSRRAHLERTS